MKNNMMLNVLLAFIFFALIFNTSFSQDKTASGFLSGIADGLSINGNIDTYLSWDNDKINSLRQFSAISPYRNEFRLNLAQISAKYEMDRVRGIATIHFGDIPSLNWPSNQQFVQEANIGFRLAKGLWIDGGYFITHIGGEGLIPMNNYFTSLSLCTYYEPFFQSGVKLSYAASETFAAQVHLVNGFNVFADNNKNKSFGIQLWGQSNPKFDITYNNLIGNEMPSGTQGKTRFYNNLVIKIFPVKKLDVIVCGDFCMQEKSKLTDTTASASMFSGFIALKYKPVKNFSMSLRGEIFQDENGFLSGVFTDANGKATGLKSNGVSFALEFNPVQNSYVRLENRLLNADKDQKIFYDNKNSRVEVNLSAGVGF
jgi:hypothetical protein